MGVLGSIAGAATSALLGGLLGGDDDEDAARAQAEAARIPDVYSPLGYQISDYSDPGNPTLISGLAPDAEENRRISNLVSQNYLTRLAGATNAAAQSPIQLLSQEAQAAQRNRLQGQELDRFTQLRQPQIERARQSLQSQLLRRGRLGLGAGGTLSGRLANPEIAGQEEAILRTQLGDVLNARDFADTEVQRQRENTLQDISARQQQQSFLLNQAQASGTLGGQLASGTIGQLGQIAAGSALNPAVALAQGAPATQRANSTSAFFSGLGLGAEKLLDQYGGGFFSGIEEEDPTLQAPIDNPYRATGGYT